MDPLIEWSKVKGIKSNSELLVLPPLKVVFPEFYKELEAETFGAGAQLMGLQFIQLELRLGKNPSRSFRPVKSAEILWQFWASSSFGVSLAHDAPISLSTGAKGFSLTLVDPATTPCCELGDCNDEDDGETGLSTQEGSRVTKSTKDSEKGKIRLLIMHQLIWGFVMMSVNEGSVLGVTSSSNNFYP
ncbi:hypothetical protein Tco_0530771 [Tanacetum coccineum]